MPPAEKGWPTALCNANGSLRLTSLVAAWVVVTALVVWTSSLRHRDDFLYDHDTRFWFVAGQCWWAGHSPYAHDTFLATWVAAFGEPPRFRSAFVYPGSVLPLSLLLGAMPWDMARVVMRIVNFLSVAGAVGLMCRVARGGHAGPLRASRSLSVALAVLAPGVALTIFQGQLSLVVTFGVCAAWVGLRERRTPLLVLGVVLASIKPQLAVVALLFLFVWRRDRGLWIALGVAVAANLLVLAWTTPLQFLADCRGSLAEHAAQEFNRPDNYDSLPTHVFGGASGKTMELVGVATACVAAVLLGVRARAKSGVPAHAEIRLFQMAVVCIGVLMPVHRYDLAIQLPLVATMWALGSSWRAVVTFVLVMAHGGASWITWHLEHSLGIVFDYHELAADLATVELVALTVWWFGDVARATTGPLLSEEGERCT